MGRHTRILAALMLAVLLLLAAAASAQTESARDVVLAAVADLAATTYHYTYDSTVISDLTTANGSQLSTVTLMSAEGDVAANGDHQTTLIATGGDSLEALKNTPGVEVDRIVANGVLYLNLTTALKTNIPALNADTGWYRVDELAARAGDSTTQAILQTLTGTPLPSRLHIDGALIVDAVEAAPESLDGAAMRVFDVKLDAIALIVAENPASPMERLKQLPEGRRLIDASTFTFSYRIWIGADDGRIHRIHGEGETALPYATLGISGGPGYDIDTHTTTDFVVSRFGEPLTIIAPTLPPT